MKQMLRVLGVVVSVTLGTPAMAGIASQCTALKYKVTGKEAYVKSRCFSKAAARGGMVDPDCLSAAELKFSNGFTNAEGKGDCFTTGDAGAIEAKVDAFVDDIAATVAGSAGGAFVASTCDANKIRGAGKKAAAKAKCYWKDVRLGGGDGTGAACVAKAEAKFGKVVDTAESRSDCHMTGQEATLESKVDAFLTDLIGALHLIPDPGPSCYDHVQNGTETDIDCGGGDCVVRCYLGQTCSDPTDCSTDNCTGGVCSYPCCEAGSFGASVCYVGWDCSSPGPPGSVCDGATGTCAAAASPGKCCVDYNYPRCWGGPGVPTACFGARNDSQFFPNATCTPIGLCE